MRILYPSNPLNNKEADGPYQEEFDKVVDAGLSCSLFDCGVPSFREFSPKPKIKENEKILYRS